MKKRYAPLFMGLSIILASTLAGCAPSSGTKYWSKSTQDEMKEVLGVVLPAHPKLEASSLEVNAGDNYIETSFSYQESAYAAGMARAKEYGQALLDEGFTLVENRKNVTDTLHFNVYEYSKKNKNPVYVEVAGGMFGDYNLAEIHNNVICGFGINALNYDNAVVRQQSWKNGHTYQDMRRSTYANEPNTTGHQINLIIPIEFEDLKFADLPGGEDQMIEYIYNGFNGPKESVQWQTLSSYYEEASYGNMTLSGGFVNFNEDPSAADAVYGDDDFNPIFSVPWTVRELIEIQAGMGDGGANATFNILDHFVQDQFMRRFKGDDVAYSDFLKDYDLNDDMYIDNVWMIYPYCSQPSQNDTTLPASLKEAGDDLFWAFTHHQFYNSTVTSRRLPYTYAWMSWDFLFGNGEFEDGKYVPYLDYSKFDYANPDYSKLDVTGRIADGTARLDTHTLIHEHGHVLGMPDYYSYDEGQSWGSLGGVDMMDHNVGDHNAYSKMGYGWTMPQVVNYPAKVTLKPFQENGDAILLPLRNTWKNNMLDEYILIEYVKPDGLNAFDGENHLNNSTFYPKTWQTPGIKVTHVDSRLGIFVSDASGNWKFSRYTDALTSQGEGTKIDIAADNTPSRSVEFENANKGGAKDKARLLQLCNPAGDLTRPMGGAATDNDLFKKGDSFLSSNLPIWYLNSGKSFGWNFTIDSITDAEAVITFKRAQ